MRTQTITPQHNLVKMVCATSIMLLLWLFTNPMHAQTNNTARTVSGVVTSLDGPLHGATVVLKGTTIGVNTNDTGAFQFPKKLKENDVLVVSYLGLKTQEIVINRLTTFIEPTLEDVPVVIYGALRTSDTTPAPAANKK